MEETTVLNSNQISRKTKFGDSYVSNKCRAKSILTDLNDFSDHVLFLFRFTGVFACGLEFLQATLLQCFIRCFLLLVL